MSYLDGRASGRKRKRKSLSGEMGAKQLKKKMLINKEELPKVKEVQIYKYKGRSGKGRVV